MEAHKGIPTVMTLVFVDDLDTGIQEIHEASHVDDYLIFLSKENLNNVVNNIQEIHKASQADDYLIYLSKENLNTIVNNIIDNPHKSYRKIK